MCVNFVVYGHVSIDWTKTSRGTAVSPGGSGYFTAFGGAKFGETLLITAAGRDYDLAWLRIPRLKVILLAVNEKTARFYHDYTGGEDREWKPEFGASLFLSPKIVPKFALKAKIWHIATQPPEKQLEIIEWLRQHGFEGIITIDTLEDYIRNQRDLLVRTFSLADVLFLNKRELELLNLFKDKVIVRKEGPDGATLLPAGIKVPAPSVDVVDTTGSGDILAGAFLSQLAAAYSLSELVRIFRQQQFAGEEQKLKIALQRAVALASKKCQGFGVSAIAESRREEGST